MPNFDDLLTRELERAGRPAAPDPQRVVEEVTRRRARRGVIRRVQSGALAVAVLAATAGGFVVLRNQFGPGPGPGPEAGRPPYGATGLVAACTTADATPLCLIPVASFGVDGIDERRFLTEGVGDIVREPDVSPDGTTVVFERHVAGDEAMSGLWTVRTDGSALTQITGADDDVWSASWSPDGSRLVAIGPAGGRAALVILTPDGTIEQTIDLPGLTINSPPRWVPDGSRISFSAAPGHAGPVDVYTVRINGSQLINITNTPLTVEYSPVWSPDGTSFAFWVGTPSGTDIRIRDTDEGNERSLLLPDGRSTQGSLPRWSPDGQWIAFERVETDQESAVYAVRVDRTDVRLLAKPAGEFAWIRDPEAVAEPPVPSASPEPRGHDIGLGFPACDVSRTRGDFNGDAQIDTAFHATKLSDTGPCDPLDAVNVVAMDLDADGLADVSYGPLEPCPATCSAFDATDLDGDGSDELVVTSFFSIMDYYLFALRPNAGGDLQIEPVLVADPGHEPASIVAGEPLRIDAGGDEGYGSHIRCEGYPIAPVIVWAWSLSVVDGAAATEVHETRIQLQSDGLFHVVGTNDYTVPAGEPTGLGEFTARACGVDWHPSP